MKRPSPGNRFGFPERPRPDGHEELIDIVIVGLIARRRSADQRLLRLPVETGTLTAIAAIVGRPSAHQTFGDKLRLFGWFHQLFSVLTGEFHNSLPNSTFCDNARKN